MLRDAEAVKIKVGVVIDAPPEVVWRTVEQIERHVDWMADAVSITFTGTRPQRRGHAVRLRDAHRPASGPTTA